jgi:STAM-binding protein
VVLIIMFYLNSKKDRERIFQLTDPGGMRAIGECAERSFHPHDLATYKECSHINFKSALHFRVIDLR